MHLRNQAFERLLDLVLAVASKIHLDRLIARPEIKRLLEFLRQFREWHVLSQAEVLHERALEIPVVSLHPFRAATPGCDCALRERLFRIGNHELRIANQLRAETMTRRTSAEMAVERKVFRCQLA